MIQNSKIKEISEEIFKLNSIEVMMLDGTKIASRISNIAKSKNIKSFSYEPNLLTDEILEWIQKRNLVLFRKNSFKRRDFFNFSIHRL